MNGTARLSKGVLREEGSEGSSCRQRGSDEQKSDTRLPGWRDPATDGKAQSSSGPKSGDRGYQGSNLRVPRKKPRNGALSDEEKRSNRRLARERIVAEHGIGKMKIWRIAADRYRNPPRRHTVMMKNLAVLHNRMYG